MQTERHVFRETNCDVCGSWNSEQLIQLQDSGYCRCVECGMIYAQPMLENVVEFNEQSYSKKLEKYASKIQLHRRHNLKKIRGLARYRQNGNFLEIGCNAGALLDVARSIGWNARGVDLAVAASAYAREKLGLDVFTGTVEEAAFPEDSFDVVFTNATLEHLRHPLSTLKECCRILRKGGVFYANTVNWDSYTQRICGAQWKLLDPMQHLHLYTPANVRRLCEGAGMELVRVWTTGVRTHFNEASDTRFGWLDLCKGPLSLLTRLTKKGDTIEFLARKPDRIVNDERLKE